MTPTPSRCLPSDHPGPPVRSCLPFATALCAIRYPSHRTEEVPKCQYPLNSHKTALQCLLLSASQTSPTCTRYLTKVRLLHDIPITRPPVPASRPSIHQSIIELSLCSTHALWPSSGFKTKHQGTDRETIALVCRTRPYQLAFSPPYNKACLKGSIPVPLSATAPLTPRSAFGPGRLSSVCRSITTPEPVTPPHTLRTNSLFSHAPPPLRSIISPLYRVVVGFTHKTHSPPISPHEPSLTHLLFHPRFFLSPTLGRYKQLLLISAH